MGMGWANIVNFNIGLNMDHPTYAKDGLDPNSRIIN